MANMTPQTLIWLIPLPPLVAFFLIVLFTNRSKALSHSLAILSALLSWAGSMLIFFLAIRTPEFGKDGNFFASAVNWLPLSDKPFQIGVQIDPLGAATLFFVGWTVLMIFLYSVGYHNYGQPKGDHDMPGLPPHGATLTDHGHTHKVPSVEPMYSRFFAFICLFAFGMYTLVVSDNLLTLFVGWEIMGLCSYLLIGFWYAKESARAAMIKAFITTRVGDVFMLLGIAYLYASAGSLSYKVIFSPAVLAKLVAAPAAGGFLGLSAAALIGLLLFIGTIGKSAQFPLHVWLPDAMEGPTPVSAMIHAATMVSAGVYMVIRVFPLLSAGWQPGNPLTPAMMAMTIIGTFTALFAATIAFTQRDIKRVLAYSTISQLGFMIAALGTGAYVAAIFHLITHAFFKALLFLGSGSVIHGVEHGVLHTGENADPQDMFNMGGLLGKMPVTGWTFIIGGLSLSGLPILTAGFWSKDEILGSAFANGYWPVFLVLAFTAFLTAFYTARQLALTFGGRGRTHSAEHASENKWTMVVPLVILAFFAVAAGWVGIPEKFMGLPFIKEGPFGQFFETMFEAVPRLPGFNWIPFLTSVVVSLGGLYLGWRLYKDLPAGAEDPLKKPLGAFYTASFNRYGIDAFYSKYLVAPAYWLAETFTFKFLDRTVIDGVLHAIAYVAANLGTIFRNYFDKPVVNGFGDFVGEGAKNIGRRFRVVQTGRIQQYMLVGLVFAFGTLIYFLIVLK